MDRRRAWWRRTNSGAVGTPADRPVPEFRSDNDLLAWRHVVRLAVALTFFGLCLLGAAHIPFAWSPVAIVPAVIAVLLIRWRAMRDRKAGKRFSLYDDDDV